MKSLARRKIWKSISLCIFWFVWKERNCIVFRDQTLVVQWLKHSFVSNLWSWNILYLGEEFTSLIDFLEWLACFCGVGEVFSSCFLAFWLPIYVPYTLYLFSLPIYKKIASSIVLAE